MRRSTPSLLTSAVLATLLPLTLSACASSSPAMTADAAAQAAGPGMGVSARAPDPLLDTVLAGSWRSRDNVARDQYRHPRETLSFFGIAADQAIVEISPGGGWYTEILAPYVRDAGQYVGAVVDPAALPAGRARENAEKGRAATQARFAGAPAQYRGATLVSYDPGAPRFGAPASADAVLTFRNVHNWRMSGQAEGMFNGFFEVLKPGGVLGVVEHRADADVPSDDSTGYVSEAQVIALAQAAGFRLDARSEANANPRDTKDHPNGVWTLPPAKRHDAEDAQKYLAIGESDRMTLRFVKP